MSHETIEVELTPVLRAIGRLVVSFNATEHLLRRIAFLLIDSGDERVGEIVLDRQNSSNLEDLTRALAEYRLRQHPELSEQIGLAISQFAGLRSQRNEIVHALWRIPNDSTDPSDIEAVRMQLRKGVNKYISSISPDVANNAAIMATNIGIQFEDLYEKVRAVMPLYK